MHNCHCSASGERISQVFGTTIEKRSINFTKSSRRRFKAARSESHCRLRGGEFPAERNIAYERVQEAEKEKYEGIQKQKQVYDLKIFPSNLYPLFIISVNQNSVIKFYCSIPCRHKDMNVDNSRSKVECLPSTSHYNDIGSNPIHNAIKRRTHTYIKFRRIRRSITRKYRSSATILFIPSFPYPVI